MITGTLTRNAANDTFTASGQEGPGHVSHRFELPHLKIGMEGDL